MKHIRLSFPLPVYPQGVEPLDRMIREVLSRDNRLCQMCGADESCRCPYDKKPISLFVRLMKPQSQIGALSPNLLQTVCSTCADGIRIIEGRSDYSKKSRPAGCDNKSVIRKCKNGEDMPGNLRAICSNCNEGLQNTSPPKPDQIHLLSQIRRATIDDQKVVLDWLLNKFRLKSLPLD